MVAFTCPRTGLQVQDCECADLVPDLTQPLTSEQREWCLDMAARRSQPVDSDDAR
jgi:hypothetical protein